MSAPTTTSMQAVHQLTGLTDCEEVQSAAVVSGGVGDAVLEVHPVEHNRRVDAGLTAATDLLLLDRLLTLPLQASLSLDDLSDFDQDVLRRAPAGVVEMSAKRVRRLLTPATTVRLVVVRSGAWRQGLRRAGAFRHFAQRALLLPQEPRGLSAKLWEADAAGVGVWVDDGNQIRQLVAPAPWKPRYVKAAGWRFSERAYLAWRKATATSPNELSGDLADRPTPRAVAAGDQPPP